MGALASHSELLVMRTAGMSVFNVTSAVLKAALVLVILVTIIGECVAPYAQHVANSEKIMAESGGQAVNTTSGLWMRYKNNFIHVQTISRGLILHGVSQYEFNSKYQMTGTRQAELAERQNGQWWLYDVKESQITPTGIISHQFAKLPWSVQVSPELLGVSKDQTEEMSLVSLYHYIRYQKANASSSTEFSLSFWQRVLQPLATLVMIFLSIPFVFGPLRSVSIGVRIVTGAVVGFGFYLLNQFFGPTT